MFSWCNSRHTLTSHVPLVLLQDYRSSRNAHPRSTLLRPHQIALDERLLESASHDLVHGKSQDAWTRREEGAEGVDHRRLRHGAHHPVVVHDREAVTYVVDDVIDDADEEGVGGGRRDEAVPEAHALVGADAGRVHGDHEPHVGWDRGVEVALEHDVHVGVYPPHDEEDAVPEEVGLERSGDYGFVRLPHLGGEVEGKEVGGGRVVPEMVLPPGTLPRLYEPGHVGVLVGRDGLEPRLLEGRKQNERRSDGPSRWK